MKTWIAVVTLFMLTGCGGGGGSDAGTGGGGTVTAGGIYEGRLNNGQNTWLTGIISEDGQAIFFEDGTNGSSIDDPGAIITLDNPVTFDSKGAFADDYFAIPEDGLVFSNGSNFETGHMAGTIVPRKSIDGVATPDQSSGNNFNLVMIDGSMRTGIYAYDTPPASLSGTWHFNYTMGGQTYTATLTLSGGNINGSDTAGCTYHGAFAQPAVSYNAYSLYFTSSCVAQDAFSGLMAYGSDGSLRIIVSDGQANMAFAGTARH